MNPDALMIISTGIALAAIDVGLFAWLCSHRKHGHTSLEDRLPGVERHLVAVGKEQARTTGLLEGLGLSGRENAATTGTN